MEGGQTGYVAWAGHDVAGQHTAVALEALEGAAGSKNLSHWVSYLGWKWYDASRRLVARH